MGMFDDLVPQTDGTAKRSGMFDDLIPKKEDRGAVQETLLPSINEGISTIFGLPVDAVAAILRLAGVKIDKPIGGSESIKSGMEALTIGTKPDESTPGRKVLAEVGRGIGTGAVFGPAGAISGVGSGLGIEAAQRLLPSTGPAGEMVGSVIGGLGAGGAVNAVSKGINAIRGQSSPLIRAMDKEKVTPRMVGDAAESPVAQSMAGPLMSAAVTGPSIQTAARQTMSEIGAAADRTAAMYGTGARPIEAGEAIAGGVQKYADSVTKAADFMYERLKTMIPGTAPSATSNTLEVSRALAGKLQNMEETAKILTPKLFKAIEKDLTPAAATVASKGTGVLDQFGREITRDILIRAKKTGELPFEELSAIRTDIGKKLIDPMLVDDAGRGQLKALYTAITMDMEQAATKAGALAQFRATNKFYRDQMRFIEGAFKNIVSNGRTPEKLFEWATAEGKVGATRLAALRKAMGDEQFGVVASVMLRRMGQAGADSPFNAGTFIRNWDALTPDAKSTLFGGGAFSGYAESVDRIAAIARAHTQSNALANTSRTAGSAKLMEWLGLLGAAAATGVGSAVGGGAGAAAGTVSGAVMGVGGAIIGQAAVSKLLTSEKFARWLATPIGENEIPKNLSLLVGIANSTPSIRDEIGAFLQAIGEQP